MASPMISVVMPVFNVAPYVKDAVQSVLDQTYTDFELIAVDDGSSDQSVEILESFSDGRIRIIRHEHNRGVAAARNTGISAAEGEFLAFLDADDLMVPSRLENQLAFMNRDPSIALSAGGTKIVGPDGKPIARAGHTVILDTSAAAPSLVFGNLFATSAWMMRRDALPAGGFQQQFAEDYDLLIRLSMTHRVSLSRDCYTYYRRRPGSAMHTADSKKKCDDLWRSQRNLFRLLHLTPSPAEKDLHQFTRVHPGAPVTADRLVETYNWYSKLIQANSDTKLYPEHAFRLATSYFWFTHLCLTAQPGLTPLRMFLRSLTFAHAQPAPKIMRALARACIPLRCG